MRIKDLFLSIVLMALLVPAAVGAGEEQIKQFSGKILLDVENHGEAWYVNPQSFQRVYLGKPDQALYRLTKRAVWVNFYNIEKIPMDGMEGTDPEYAEQMAGYVMAPNDLIGASWYIHPVLKTRIRLGTPQDAWVALQTGIPVGAKDLNMIPVESEVEFVPSGDYKVKEVTATDTIVLEDDTEIKLMSVDAPDNVEYQEPAKARLQTLIDENDGTVCLKADAKDEASNGAKIRMVEVGNVLLNLEVVRQGWAFHNIEFPNYKNAEMMIVGGIDAEMHKNGFWNK